MSLTVATSSKEIFNQYYNTQNPVTRWSLLSSLRSRVERGDNDAEEYVYDIEQTKALVKDNRTPIEDEPFTHDELLFIATHVCTPDDIKYYVLRGDVSGGFELGGLIYQYHEDDVITLNGEVIDVTPDFLINVIHGYDTHHRLTKTRMHLLFSYLVENTPFTTRSYLSEILRIRDYVSTQLEGNYLPLHKCPSEYIRRALYTIDKYGIERVKGVLSKSLTKRLLLKDITPTRGLKITATLIGGINVSDPHLPGLAILADNHRNGKCTDEYTAHVDPTALTQFDTDWQGGDVLPVCTHVALHLLELSKTILTGFDKVMSDRVALNERPLFDTFIYDGVDINNIIALGMAVQAHHVQKNYHYDFYDIQGDVPAGAFTGKRVCFIGTYYPSDEMKRCEEMAGEVVVLEGDDMSGIVNKAWDYFIDMSRPLVISVFDDMEFQEYLSHISLAQQEGRHPSPLNRIYPFMDELMKGVRSGDVDQQYQTILNHLLNY